MYSLPFIGLDSTVVRYHVQFVATLLLSLSPRYVQLMAVARKVGFGWFFNI